MKVKDVMTRQPRYIDYQSNLSEAARLMREQDFGFLPVGKDDRLIGMITDRDLTVRGAAEGFDPRSTPVSKIMTVKVLYVFENDELDYALKNMQDQQVRRLIVLNDKDHKRFTGVLSLGDCARQCGNDELCGETLEHICS